MPPLLPIVHVPAQLIVRASNGSATCGPSQLISTSLLSQASSAAIALSPSGPYASMSTNATSNCDAYVVYTFGNQSQVDAASNYLGNASNVGVLAVDAKIPCGSIITIIGQLSGPRALSCDPVSIDMQQLGYSYTSGILQLCCPVFSIEAINDSCSINQTMDQHSLLSSAIALVLAAPSAGIPDSSTPTLKGPCDTVIDFAYGTQAQVCKTIGIRV